MEIRILSRPQMQIEFPPNYVPKHKWFNVKMKTYNKEEYIEITPAKQEELSDSLRKCCVVTVDDTVRYRLSVNRILDKSWQGSYEIKEGNLFQIHRENKVKSTKTPINNSEYKVEFKPIYEKKSCVNYAIAFLGKKASFFLTEQAQITFDEDDKIQITPVSNYDYVMLTRRHQSSMIKRGNRYVVQIANDEVEKYNKNIQVFYMNSEYQLYETEEKVRSMPEKKVEPPVQKEYPFEEKAKIRTTKLGAITLHFPMPLLKQIGFQDYLNIKKEGNRLFVSPTQRQNENMRKYSHRTAYCTVNGIIDKSWLGEYPCHISLDKHQIVIYLSEREDLPNTRSQNKTDNEPTSQSSKDSKISKDSKNSQPSIKNNAKKIEKEKGKTKPATTEGINKDFQKNLLLNLASLTQSANQEGDLNTVQALLSATTQIIENL